MSKREQADFNTLLVVSIFIFLQSLNTFIFYFLLFQKVSDLISMNEELQQHHHHQQQQHQLQQQQLQQQQQQRSQQHNGKADVEQNIEVKREPA